MRRFGYLAGDAGGDGNIVAETLYHESAIVEAIKNVQKYGALEQTGQLDNDTLNVCKANVKNYDYTVGSQGRVVVVFTYFHSFWQKFIYVHSAHYV